MGLRQPLHAVKRIFPIIGGGIKQGDLPQLLRDLGPKAGVRAFRQGIELLMEGGDFRAAEGCPELQAALEKWSRGEARG